MGEGLVEVFIFFATCFLTITNAFARAFDRQNVSLVAPFALADKSTSRVLILVREARVRAHLDNDHDLVELLVTDRKRRANEGLEGCAWEVDSGIFLAAITILFTIKARYKVRM